MSETALNRGLPGGVAISRLRVYDWPAADGLHGGSPHLHTASAEAYLVLTGHGTVQTLNAQGFATTALEPGTVAWFSPGTVHRLINEDGELEILTLMSNAGLPEAGDAVLTFPPDILGNPQQYAAHATLPTDNTEEVARAARQRRDLALEGFAELQARATHDLNGTLASLYGSAAALVADHARTWRRIVESGPAAQVRATMRQLTQLAIRRAGDMTDSGIRSTPPRAGERYGMCGMLTTWETGPE